MELLWIKGSGIAVSSSKKYRIEVVQQSETDTVRLSQQLYLAPILAAYNAQKLTNVWGFFMANWEVQAANDCFLYRIS
jgi:hypothetical protein